MKNVSVFISEDNTRNDIYNTNGRHGSVGLPSQIEREFWEIYNTKGWGRAVEWYYQLEKRYDYIKTKEIERNIQWEHSSKYGNLQVTINLSKPEKDPKEIAKLLQQSDSISPNGENAITKPKCHLCLENEGYQDGVHENMRIIKLPKLLKNDMHWYFQYSPYSYYNEHCIVLGEKHIPMKITHDTFSRLLELIEIFPEYMFGSNTDIPIVGGSILNHDHYQGGRHTFPMDNAKILGTYHTDAYPDLKIEHLKWPLSTLRIKSTNKEQLVSFADKTLQKWIEYSDKKNDIINQTDGVRHNAITPIARKRNNIFELDLVLRNNRTSDEFPDGIFHPHQEYHYIKKENIGLIEVLGLAILPPRLKTDLEAGKINTEEIGVVFEKVLENCGVFKLNDQGIKGFETFIKTLL